MSALGVMVASQSASARALAQLSGEELAQIDRGVPIVKSQDMPGSSWPAVTVYQIVNTTPEEAMAVFTDYGEQASYLKGCCGVLDSRVLDAAVGGDKRVQRVLYELQVPVVANERYELREEMSKSPYGSYRVVWRKVSLGGHSQDIVGQATFEPRGGKTLFSYNNFTRINELGAGFFANQSVERARQTVAAMARHMEEEQASGGVGFQRDLFRLRAALGG
jgi:hypothetical protein